jgi:hypothetical protein
LYISTLVTGIIALFCSTDNLLIPHTSSAENIRTSKKHLVHRNEMFCDLTAVSLAILIPIIFRTFS